MVEEEEAIKIKIIATTTQIEMRNVIIIGIMTDREITPTTETTTVIETTIVDSSKEVQHVIEEMNMGLNSLLLLNTINTTIKLTILNMTEVSSLINLSNSSLQVLGYNSMLITLVDHLYLLI